MEPEPTSEAYLDYEETEDLLTCDLSEWSSTYYIILALYALTFILGVSGNGLVLFTALRPADRRLAGDAYVGGVALADLTFVVTLPLWAVSGAMDDRWPFGAVLCKLSSYVANLNMYARVFCLTCMVYDWYLTAVRSPSGSRGRTRGTLAAVWLLSGLLAAPGLVFRNVKHDPATNHTSCTVDLSLVATNEEQENLWLAGLSLSSAALGFLLPSLAMTACFCFIYRSSALWKEDRHKRGLLKTTTSVVVVFAACWMPLHVLKSVNAVFYLELVPVTCDFLYLVLQVHPYATCLAYISCCLNPFLYAVYNPLFRARCLLLLKPKRFSRSS